MSADDAPLHPYVRKVEEVLRPHYNSANAEPMTTYMRGRFDFLGIKASQRKELVHQLMSRPRLPAVEDIEDVVRGFWSLDKRELQYVAVDLLRKYTKRLPESFLEVAEYLIVTKSWWDTVDALASHTVGGLVTRFPAAGLAKVDAWHRSNNLWLRRTAVLFQLRYKTQTDEALLFRMALDEREDPEFFIQKAIGWSLREYSKVAPEAVTRFVEASKLSPLATREALKWINKPAKPKT